MMLPPEHRPNLLGIGAAKAGTTWLASLLNQHPDIFMPPQKELNALHYDDLEERLDEYAEYFSSAEYSRIRCDFSVRYLNSLNAPRAARRHVPEAKILMIARNPIDQIQSHYWHLRRQNFHQSQPVSPPPDLFRALERFPELLLEPARYGKHLARWMAFWPKERILAIRYEDLVRETNVTLSQICDFLDIPRFNFVQVENASNTRKGVQPRTGILNTIYPLLYSGASGYVLAPLKSWLGVRRADQVKRLLKLRQLSESLFFKPGYEPLNSAQTQQLWALFRQDMQEFAGLSGLDIAQWEPQQ